MPEKGRNDFIFIDFHCIFTSLVRMHYGYLCSIFFRMFKKKYIEPNGPNTVTNIKTICVNFKNKNKYFE